MLRGSDSRPLLSRGIAVVIQGGEAVFHLLKRSDDGTAVVVRGGVELRARLGNLRASQAGIEDAEQDIGTDGPIGAWCAQPVGEGIAFKAALAARRRGRKKAGGAV